MLIDARASSPIRHVITVFIVTTAIFISSAGTWPEAGAAESAESESAITLLSPETLEELVGPIALYPDELIAVTLPASTFPLQIVQAARFLEKHKKDSSLKPSEDWDSSVLGLVNYPEVIEKMNSDLGWTERLGDAVVNQQDDVMDAIQTFRNKAHDAGNLKSDKQVIIIQEKEIITIESATPEVIYVPTYNPSTVIVYSSSPYRYYYSTPYPYYYSPAATFWTGLFVGAAISYGVGWRGHRGGHNDININRSVNISGNTINRGSGNTWKSNRGRGSSGGRPSVGKRPGTSPGAGNRPGSRPGAGTRPGSRPGAGKTPRQGGAKTQPARSKGKTASTKRKPLASTKRQPSRTSKSGRSGSSFGNYNSGKRSSTHSNRGKTSRSSHSSNRSSSRASRGGGGRASRGGGRGRR